MSSNSGAYSFMQPSAPGGEKAGEGIAASQNPSTSPVGRTGRLTVGVGCSTRITSFLLHCPATVPITFISNLFLLLLLLLLYHFIIYCNLPFAACICVL